MNMRIGRRARRGMIRFLRWLQISKSIFSASRVSSHLNESYRELGKLLFVQYRGEKPLTSGTVNATPQMVDILKSIEVHQGTLMQYEQQIQRLKRLVAKRSC